MTSHYNESEHFDVEGFAVTVIFKTDHYMVEAQGQSHAWSAGHYYPYNRAHVKDAVRQTAKTNLRWAIGIIENERNST